VIQRPRFGVYTGALAAIFHVEAGVEDVVSETYRGAGAVIGLRAHSRPPRARFSQDLEAGAFYGRCADQMCNDGRAFVSLQLAWRLHIKLF